MGRRDDHERKYYAVYKGRVDKPTIYSSWSHVHPRVTGFDGAELTSLEDARNSMRQKGLEEVDEAWKCTEALKCTAGYIATQPCRGTYYYAVAYGRTIGIFRDWRSAEKSTSQYTNACHQRFNTEREANGFIEDWNDAYADAWRWEVRKGLHDGWKAKSLNFDLEPALVKMQSEGDTVKSLIKNLKGLDLEKEPEE